MVKHGFRLGSPLFVNRVGLVASSLFIVSLSASVCSADFLEKAKVSFGKIASVYFQSSWKTPATQSTSVGTTAANIKIISKTPATTWAASASASTGNTRQTAQQMKDYLKSKYGIDISNPVTQAFINKKYNFTTREFTTAELKVIDAFCSALPANLRPKSITAVNKPTDGSFNNVQASYENGQTVKTIVIPGELASDPASLSGNLAHENMHALFMEGTLTTEQKTKAINLFNASNQASDEDFSYKRDNVDEDLSALASCYLLNSETYYNKGMANQSSVFLQKVALQADIFKHEKDGAAYTYTFKTEGNNIIRKEVPLVNMTHLATGVQCVVPDFTPGHETETLTIPFM